MWAKLFISISVLCSILFTTQNSLASVESILGKIPVQDAGRLKPLDTFARESLQLIYGKKSFAGKPAVEVVFTWMMLPQQWDDIEFVQIENNPLKKTLKLDINKKRFSPNHLFQIEELQVIFNDLQDRKTNQEKLNNYYQAVERLQSQLTLYKAITQGYMPGFIPPAEGTTWTPLKDFSEEYAALFLGITKGFVEYIKDHKQLGDLGKATQIFIERARSENLTLSPSQRILNLEYQYNVFQPFQWSWILYLISAVLFLFYFISQKNILFKFSWYLLLVSFLIHTYGFILRMVITGRPPVSNMFETVVWVSWGAVFFSIIFMKIWKNKVIIFAAAMVSFICLVLTDMAPIILDGSLQPLQPVLRSHLWLTVHVLTITISYGAFFLAFVLGDFSLVLYLLGEKKYQAQLNSIRDIMYRSVQVGVVFLGAGTILGGVWADYSWGRFWGWDPKETWALIAFLGYIAILHGRLAGWIRPFGFVFWNILAFNLVVMAWYGVNYVLGAGLHSYGFGGGGLPFVAAFCGLHVLFASTVWFLRSQKLLKN